MGSVVLGRRFTPQWTHIKRFFTSVFYILVFTLHKIHQAVSNSNKYPSLFIVFPWICTTILRGNTVFGVYEIEIFFISKWFFWYYIDAEFVVGHWILITDLLHCHCVYVRLSKERNIKFQDITHWGWLHTLTLKTTKYANCRLAYLFI